MGKIIAIEGIDGSGKGTQSILVSDQLKSHGLSTTVRSFPEYKNHFFGAEVGNFLNGEFGGLNDVHPKLASILYAGDRFEALQELKQDVLENDFVICDRYTPSNVAHQSAKLENLDDRKAFEAWVYRLEYEVFSIPLPDEVIVLDINPDVSAGLIDQKEQRSYTKEKKDLHESDSSYLSSVRDVYLELAKVNNWIVINCLEDGKMRKKDAITNNILDSLFKRFPDISMDIVSVI